MPDTVDTALGNALGTILQMNTNFCRKVSPQGISEVLSLSQTSDALPSTVESLPFIPLMSTAALGILDTGNLIGLLVAHSVHCKK